MVRQMIKRGRWGWTCIMALFLFLQTAVGTGAAQDTGAFRIAVASDLHLDPGTTQKGAVNPLVPYNSEITDALFGDVLEEKADVLLLLGDMTNSGRTSQHRALLEKMETAKEKGLTILVLPGNHDIGEVRPDEFADLYAEYGYEKAYSRDKASLSYSYRIGEVLFLMLDTDGYSGSVTTARLSDKTLDWIEEQIRSAREEGLEIIPAEHYSLLTGQTTEFIGAERMKEILEKNEIPLLLCGHIHHRCVASDGKLHELSLDAATAYPCCYGMLEYREDASFRYEPRTIDVDRWAGRQEEIDPIFLDFSNFKKERFEEKCKETVELLGDQHKLSGEEKEAALSFFIRFQEDFAGGCLGQDVQTLKEHAGYEIFMSIAEGTVYGRWVPVALETAVPQTQGFVLKDGVFSDEG